MLGGARKQSSRDFNGFGAASEANFITELHLKSTLAAAASILAGQGTASAAASTRPGQGRARAAAPFFLPGKERQERWHSFVPGKGAQKGAALFSAGQGRARAAAPFRVGPRKSSGTAPCRARPKNNSQKETERGLHRSSPRTGGLDERSESEMLWADLVKAGPQVRRRHGRGLS
jgi:hypothetical protein